MIIGLLNNLLNSSFFLTCFTIMLTSGINFFLQKNHLLLDKIDYSGHKKFISNTPVPLSLGLVFIIVFFFFLTNVNSNLKFFLLSLFFLGILSDLFFLKKPSNKFIIQILIVTFFAQQNLFLISSLKNNILFEILFNHYFFKLFFTILCVCILINGTNFCDGINTLSIGNYLLITIFLIFVSLKYNLDVSAFYLDKIILILIIIFFFNFLGKAFLGDSGSFMLGGYFAYVVITFFENNSFISPIYVVLLVWYPCFEVLFSIIRKKILKKGISIPDNCHLHHLIFKQIKKILKLKDNNSYYNSSLSALSIHVYNFFIYFIGSQYVYNSTVLGCLLLINLLIYVFVYNVLFKQNVR